MPNEILLQQKVNKRADSNYYEYPSYVIRVVRYAITGAPGQRTGLYQYQRPFMPVGIINYTSADDVFGAVLSPATVTVPFITAFDKRILGFNMATELEASPTLTFLYKLLKELTEIDGLNLTGNVLGLIKTMPPELFFPPQTCTLDNGQATEHFDNAYGVVIVEIQ